MSEMSIKMTRLLKQIDEAEKKLENDKKHLKLLNDNLSVLAASEIAIATNTDVRNFSNLIKEHEMIQKMKENGMTDEDINALAGGKNIKEKQEDNEDEKKIF